MPSPSMTLPQLIGEAASNLDNDRLGRLPLAVRRRLLVSLDGTGDGRDVARLSRWRRTYLDALCVRKGLPYWDLVFPDDRGPRAMLDLAFASLDGAVGVKEAESRRNSFYVDAVENRRYTPGEQPALFVAHAAANTVLTALSDPAGGEDDQDADDEALDAEAYEPSYLIASAFAGGLDRSTIADVDARRAFWHWYLETAIAETLAARPAA